MSFKKQVPKHLYWTGYDKSVKFTRQRITRSNSCLQLQVCALTFPLLVQLFGQRDWHRDHFGVHTARCFSLERTDQPKLLYLHRVAPELWFAWWINWSSSIWPPDGFFVCSFETPMESSPGKSDKDLNNNNDNNNNGSFESVEQLVRSAKQSRRLNLSHRLLDQVCFWYHFRCKAQFILCLWPVMEFTCRLALQIPVGVFDLVSLIELDLSDNHLTYISPGMCFFRACPVRTCVRTRSTALREPHEHTYALHLF
jgi:hypothetical protein